MVPGPEHARSRERLEHICSAASDDRLLRLELLREIRAVVAFDAHVWLLTDPRTTVGAAPLADVPTLAELPKTIRLKYLTPVNRWSNMLADDVAVTTLRMATSDEPAHSSLWRDLLRAYDVVDVASVVLTDRFGCWGFLDLWRTNPAPAFNADDAAYLASITTRVTAALRARQAQSFDDRPAGGRAILGPMVLVLDDQLHVQRQTDATAAWLAVLLPAAEGAAPIPAAAYNVAAQLLAVEHGVDAHEPSARVHLVDGIWVTLRAARLGADQIAVTIEETTAADRLELFCRCSGLSPRETELLTHLAAGADTRDIAARMYLSAHTVQDHLKSIFDKTHSHNRRSLLSRALGPR